MNDVTIERAKEEKKEMEAKIFDAVKNFEDSTKLLVEDVIVSKIRFPNMPYANCLHSIECEVKL